MKRFVCFCLALAFAFFMRGSFYAAMRVGISAYQNAALVPVGNNEIHIGFASDMGFSASAVLYTTGAFSVTPANLYYVRPDNTYSNYETAKQAADSFNAGGFGACVGITDDSLFMVYIGGFNGEAEAARALNAYPAAVLLSPASHRTAINIDGNPIVIFDNPSKNAQIKGNETTVGSRRYRGTIEILRGNSGVSAVNVLSVDEYLYSVVPSEMPSSWHIEALKAQAVASRSYAATRAGVHTNAGYDLCDREHCQMYLGISSEKETATRAVAETTGIMAYYENEIINAVYSSSSGGATANSEDVWTEAVPYLRGVADTYDTTGKNWQRSISLSEMTSLLISNGYDIGSAVSVAIDTVSAQGRVNKLVITGTSGTASLDKEEVRTFFSGLSGGSLESRYFSFGEDFSKPNISLGAASVFVRGAQETGEYAINSLYAHLFEGIPAVKVANGAVVISAGGISNINPVTDNSAADNIAASDAGAGLVWTKDPVIITGYGYGHGVGMSQHGANGMAQAGFSYREILTHYYTGIDIR